MAADPLTLRLTLASVARADGLVRLLRARLGRPPRAPLVAAFAFGADERPFARALLTRHARWWLWRTHQRRFAGDFVAIDMSEPAAARRRVYALDLKLGAPVKEGGGAGNAFVGLDAALAEIARETSAVDVGAPVVKLTGDGEGLLEELAG